MVDISRSCYLDSIYIYIIYGNKNYLIICTFDETLDDKCRFHPDSSNIPCVVNAHYLNTR